MQLITAHAAYLAENPGLRVRLEGHADERGSREYNLGLGERRSQSVERLLVLNGAGGNQLETISFGEERPAALGHDENAWWQNRRVEIVYPAR
jgi:peptidoglycan-associated lipoprotein